MSREIGIDRSYLSQLERGRREILSWVVERVEAIERSVENSTSSNPSENVALSGPVPVDQIYFRRVPVVSWAKAGEATNYDDLCNQIDEVVETDSKDPNSFGLIIEGDSMEPEFQAGDIVVFAPNSEARNGDIVVARLKETGGVFFKRFRRSGPEGGTVRLESVNPDYKTLEFPSSAFRFVYPAVGMKRKLRR